MAPKVRFAAAKGKAKAKAKALARPKAAALPVHAAGLPLHVGGLPVGPPVQSAVFSADNGHMRGAVNLARGQYNVDINSESISTMLNRPVTLAHAACTLERVNMPGTPLGKGLGKGTPNLPPFARWHMLGSCDIVSPGGVPQAPVTLDISIGADHAQMVIQ